MTIESKGYVLPPEKGGEEEKNRELIRRVEELSSKLQEMRERHGGEYPERMLDMTSEDEEIHNAIRKFFEDDCQGITPIEVGRGGNYNSDELKRLSDSVWLLREVTADYDVDQHEYTVIDKEKARELLQDIIETRSRQIKTLEAQNQEAEKLLSGIK